MTHFADLTKYSYSRSQSPKTLNFGWLDASQPFLKGPTDPLVTNYLNDLKLEDLFRGFHICNLCKESKSGPGNGTKFVRAPNGMTYATPAMIMHYIIEHNYWVPQEIQEEILKMAK